MDRPRALPVTARAGDPFVWFDLMPSPDLPDAVREQHRSVWVDIDSRLFDPARGRAVYHECLDQLEDATASASTASASDEHHQNGYGIMPSPNTISKHLG